MEMVQLSCGAENNIDQMGAGSNAMALSTPKSPRMVATRSRTSPTPRTFTTAVKITQMVFYGHLFLAS